MLARASLSPVSLFGHFLVFLFLVFLPPLLPVPSLALTRLPRRTTELIRSGNRHMKSAIKHTSSSRKMWLFIMVGLTLTLLFLDWLKG